MDGSTDTTPTEEIARFCTDDVTYTDFASEVVRRSKELLLDTLGVAIRASRMESSRTIRHGVGLGRGEGSGGRCTVWGTGETTSSLDAAFLNGTFAHSIEMDDTHGRSVLHPGASVIPAAVATAEERGSDGTALLEGIVAGYEVAVRLGLALPATEHVKRGFHTTATCGIFGATTAAAVTAGVTPSVLRNALAINLNQTAGSRQSHAGELSVAGGGETWDKRIHCGLAARSALFSFALAENGFRGSKEPLTGEFGFLNLYSANPLPERLTEGLGDSYELLGTSIKPHACCRQFHSAIDATLHAVTTNDVSPEEITGITLYCPDRAQLKSLPVERKTRPDSVVEAQFSPQYAVGVAIVDRAASVDQYSQARLSDPELLAVMNMVTVVEDDRMSERYPDEWPAKVVIETSHGTYSAKRSIPLGDPENALSTEEIESKFADLVCPLAGEPQTKAIVDAGLTVDDESGVRRLGEALRGVKGP